MVTALDWGSRKWNLLAGQHLFGELQPTREQKLRLSLASTHMNTHTHVHLCTNTRTCTTHIHTCCCGSRRGTDCESPHMLSYGVCTVNRTVSTEPTVFLFEDLIEIRDSASRTTGRTATGESWDREWVTQSDLPFRKILLAAVRIVSWPTCP